MMLLPQTMDRIISLGGGVIIDASKFLPQSLERFAALAALSGAHLTFNNCSHLLPQTLERIAALGKGRVVFNLSN